MSEERVWTEPPITPREVTFGHYLLALLSALRDRSLTWAALVMSFAMAGAVVWRPGPWLAGVAVVFIGVASPLWLRRERKS